MLDLLHNTTWVVVGKPRGIGRAPVSKAKIASRPSNNKQRSEHRSHSRKNKGSSQPRSSKECQSHGRRVMNTKQTSPPRSLIATRIAQQQRITIQPQWPCAWATSSQHLSWANLIWTTRPPWSKYNQNLFVKRKPAQSFGMSDVDNRERNNHSTQCGLPPTKRTIPNSNYSVSPSPLPSNKSGSKKYFSRITWWAHMRLSTCPRHIPSRKCFTCKMNTTSPNKATARPRARNPNAWSTKLHDDVQFPCHNTKGQFVSQSIAKNDQVEFP